jgi:hypothetical protein
MERGDYKSMVIWNSIVFISMDTKHVFSASNYHEDNEVVSISRPLKNSQRITIDSTKEYPATILIASRKHIGFESSFIF